jgi:hypothetical protein
MNDPIVNEVRMFRDEHAKSFNYDLKAICDDYSSHTLVLFGMLLAIFMK